MAFYDWLGTTKLAPSTVEDYFYCIKSKISEWANEHKVTDKNLLQVTDWNEWIDIKKGINSIPIISHGMNQLTTNTVALSNGINATCMT